VIGLKRIRSLKQGCPGHAASPKGLWLVGHTPWVQIALMKNIEPPKNKYSESHLRAFQENHS
jgi:hypothetical protein